MSKDMKKHSIKGRILEFLRENKVATSAELARFLNVSWNTAERYLLELALEGRIERIKKDKITIWMKK